MSVPLFISPVQAEIVTELEAWRILSANSQNLHDKMRSNVNVGVDPSLYEKEIEKISESFEFLKRKGILISKTIKVDPENLGKILDESGFFELLMKEYGIFVASEMVDCGKIYRDRDLVNSGEVQLKLHLPKKYYAKILEIEKGTKVPDKGTKVPDK